MIPFREAKAVLFDLDGVITPTADVHRQAWKETFDGFLAGRGITEAFSGDDYHRYVDGKPRYDGVRSFLASREITLPEGDTEDPPGHGTVQALGNLKNQAFRQVLAREGIRPYPGSSRLLDLLDRRRVPWAIVSSSANAADVLTAAGLEGRAATVVDGVEARRRRLAGKPAPDTFLAAAADLGVVPAEAVVVEDAISGVHAGRAGGFGLVVGVARQNAGDELLRAGADRVVSDLDELADEPAR